MSPVTAKLLSSPADLDAAFALRHQVFVVEQQVPVELERDEHDATAAHAGAFDAAGLLVGTGRLVALDGRVGKVGRMAVAATRRGEGLGAAVLAVLEEVAVERGLREIVLHAQVSARGFYDRLGYAAEGEEFEEAGIAHVTMRKRLP